MPILEISSRKSNRKWWAATVPWNELAADLFYIIDGLLERCILSLPFSLFRSMISCCSNLCFSISSWRCCSNFLFCSSSCWRFAARISCCCCSGRKSESRIRAQGDDVYREDSKGHTLRCSCSCTSCWRVKTSCCFWNSANSSCFWSSCCCLSKSSSCWSCFSLSAGSTVLSALRRGSVRRSTGPPLPPPWSPPPPTGLCIPDGNKVFTSTAGKRAN